MASISGNLGDPSGKRARLTTLPIDIDVGLQRHLVGGVALDQFNTQGAKLVAHGGVDAGVATGDAVAGFPCQGGQAAHKGAANAKNM